MSLVETKTYVTDVYNRYEVSFVRDKRTAMEWFKKIVHEKISNVQNIEIDDLNTFHDGTETVSLSLTDVCEDFVDKYYEMAKWISVSFIFNQVYFVLQIDIEKLQIIIGTKQKNIHLVNELEKQLKLA